MGIIKRTKKEVKPLMEQLKPKMKEVKKADSKALGRTVAERQSDPKRQEAQKQAMEIFEDLKGAYHQVTRAVMETQMKARRAGMGKQMELMREGGEYSRKIDNAGKNLARAAQQKMG